MNHWPKLMSNNLTNPKSSTKKILFTSFRNSLKLSLRICKCKAISVSLSKLLLLIPWLKKVTTKNNGLWNISSTTENPYPFLKRKSPIWKINSLPFSICNSITSAPNNSSSNSTKNLPKPSKPSFPSLLIFTPMENCHLKRNNKIPSMKKNSSLNTFFLFKALTKISLVNISVKITKKLSKFYINFVIFLILEICNSI